MGVSFSFPESRMVGKEVRLAKDNCTSAHCGKVCYWHKDHTPDRSLFSHVLSADPPSIEIDNLASEPVETVALDNASFASSLESAV